MAVTQYIGSRYVPMFADPLDWDSANEYEPLTIVAYQGNSYTSRQYVPSGIQITDTTYWALTGNYNSQIEQYRTEVVELGNQVADMQSDVDNALAEVNNMKTSVTQLQGDVTQIEGNITTINGEISTTNGNVTALTSRVGTTENDIDTLQTQMGTANSNISTLQTQMGTANENISENTSDIASINSRISTSSANVTVTEDWQADNCTVSKVMGMVSCIINMSYLQGSAMNGVYATIPEGYRPTKNVRAAATINGTSTCEAGYIEFRPNGEVFCFSGAASGIQIVCTATWTVS